MATDKKDIELRSEKVRNIVGKVPPLLLRKGIVIISLVILFFVTGAYFMPYPETFHAKAKIITMPSVELIKAPCSGITYLSETEQPRVSKDQKLGSLFVKDSLVNLTSPIRGKLIVNSINGGFVEQGDILFAVIPDTITTLYCRGYIPGEVINRIRVGQKVDVRYVATDAMNGRIAHGKISQRCLLPADTLHNPYNIAISLNEPPSCCVLENPLQEVDVTIYLSEKTVLKRFLESVGLK